MYGIIAKINLWLVGLNDDERGQWYAGPGGLLGIIAAIVFIIACIVFIWINVRVDEK